MHVVGLDMVFALAVGRCCDKFTRENDLDVVIFGAWICKCNARLN